MRRKLGSYAAPILVVLVAFLSFAAVVSAAQALDPGSGAERLNLDVERVEVDVTGSDVQFDVEYTTSLSVRITMFLFGSGDLQDAIAAHLGVDDAEFTSVSSSGASLRAAAEGEIEFAEEVREVVVRQRGQTRTYESTRTVDLD